MLVEHAVGVALLKAHQDAAPLDTAGEGESGVLEDLLGKGRQGGGLVVPVEGERRGGVDGRSRGDGGG